MYIYRCVCVCVCICVCVYQFSSVTQLCPTLCDPMNCSTPGLPVHHQLQSLSKLMSIESEMTFNHLILCRPLLLLSSIFPNIKVFSNESAHRIRWPKYWRCVCVYIYIYIYIYIASLVYATINWAIWKSYSNFIHSDIFIHKTEVTKYTLQNCLNIKNGIGPSYFYLLRVLGKYKSSFFTVSKLSYRYAVQGSSTQTYRKKLVCFTPQNVKT